MDRQQEQCLPHKKLVLLNPKGGSGKTTVSQAVSGEAQNALPQAERQAIRDFLSGLNDGKTLVMLGSRGDETWFDRRTFFDNAFEQS